MQEIKNTQATQSTSNAQTLTDLCKEIYESRSFYYIEMLLDAFYKDFEGPELVTVVAMQQAKSLDACHLIAAEHLGLHTEAAQIRAHIAAKIGKAKEEAEWLLD